MNTIILDCDPGMDDSMAIIMACKSPSIKVRAITTTHGNYPVAITSMNALKILELLGKTDIPVAKGMSCPMVRNSPKDPFTHGMDGQADAGLPKPVAELRDVHAVNLIIDTVKAHPHEITIVCTGPMTNLAMAMRIDPSIIGLVKSVVAITGMFGLNSHAFLNATGDTPQSEWNVYVDPEAAKIVYESGISLTAIGLDVATSFKVDFSPSDLVQLKNSENPEAKFLSNAIDFVQFRGYGAYCAVIDCMAIAYVVDPNLFSIKPARVSIETKEGLTLGMTVRDGRAHHAWTQLPVINIADNADYSRFLKLLKDTILC